MKTILVCNYLPDRQESMERFAMMLKSGLGTRGQNVVIRRPEAVFARWCSATTSGAGKWLGYLDKWIVFPALLRWHRLFDGPAWYHICDHSNAPYLAHLPWNRTSITCHDVLAIRGALGYADAFCGTSRLGKILQTWILGNLRKARRLAADSVLTLRQLRELATPSPDSYWKVIPIGFNGDFECLSRETSKPILNQLGIADGCNYILHVGSDLPRKNRGLLLEMAAILRGRWNGKICFAGAAIDCGLRERINQLGLSDRIIEAIRPDHTTLLALYTNCEAFIFPSFSEGFGWPLIEAQACGVPVIASNVEPMPEVSGGTAIHVDPSDPHAFAAALLSLREAAKREQLVKAGFQNCGRYQPAAMIEAYAHLMELPEDGSSNSFRA